MKKIDDEPLNYIFLVFILHAMLLLLSDAVGQTTSKDEGHQFNQGDGKTSPTNNISVTGPEINELGLATDLVWVSASIGSR